MEILTAVLLGAVQGVTEFLPISSTGHLILVEHWLGISQAKFGLAFDASLHIGTLIAVLWFFRSEWLKLLRSIIRMTEEDQKDIRDARLIKLLIIGTVPAVILGLVLEDTIGTLFRSPTLVAMSLILFSAILYYVEKIGSKQKVINQLSLRDGLLIGVAQAIALIPGVSRSGITMSAGMWRELTREEAARFAFLLSAPIVAGAGGLKLIKTIILFSRGDLGTSDMWFFGVGMASAAFFGYLTIKYFLQFLTRHTLYPFIVYRVLLGILVLLFT